MGEAICHKALTLPSCNFHFRLGFRIQGGLGVHHTLPRLKYSFFKAALYAICKKNNFLIIEILSNILQFSQKFNEFNLASLRV